MNFLFAFSKIEEAFYASKFRLNGKKVLKKSIMVSLYIYVIAKIMS